MSAVLEEINESVFAGLRAEMDKAQPKLDADLTLWARAAPESEMLAQLPLWLGMVLRVQVDASKTFYRVEVQFHKDAFLRLMEGRPRTRAAEDTTQARADAEAGSWPRRGWRPFRTSLSGAGR